MDAASQVQLERHFVASKSALQHTHWTIWGLLRQYKQQCHNTEDEDASMSRSQQKSGMQAVEPIQTPLKEMISTPNAESSLP
jgi:hypothetical protein